MNHQIKNLIVYEDNLIMKIKFKLSSNNQMKKDITSFIEDVYSIKNIRDTIVFSVEPYELKIQLENSYNEEDIIEYINEIEIICDENEPAHIECTFFKKIINHCISIYSLSKYEEYLDSLSIENLLGKYQEFFKDHTYILFDLILDEGLFNTQKFYFCDSKNTIDIKNNTDREQIINKRENFCNYVGESKISFIPDDFYFINKPTDINIEKIYNKLTVAISVIYISNISSIKDNKLSYKIEGYKTLKGEFNYEGEKEFSQAAFSLWEIYEWIYNNLNNVSDKLGIARNIITLNISDSNILNIDASIVASIRSGYEIYLKENAERYIDVMNQQLIFINETNSSIHELVSDFYKKFHNNLVGISSFIFTTMVINVISTGSFNNIFTFEITWICIALLVISALYLFVSRVESNSNLKKIKQKYDRNKSFYRLIIDEHDLNRILKNDEYYKEDEEFFNKQIKMYTIFWILVGIILFILLRIVGTFDKIIQ